MSEDLGEYRGFVGLELSATDKNTLTIDGISIHGNIIAVCKGDKNGLISVQYLKKSKD